jgi:hypothetical protein
MALLKLIAALILEYDVLSSLPKETQAMACAQHRTCLKKKLGWVQDFNQSRASLRVLVLFVQ